MSRGGESRDRVTAHNAASWLTGPILVVGCFAPLTFPCGATWQFLLMQLVVIGLALCAYRLTPSRSAAGRITLLVTWLLLSWGAAANLHQWTVACGHTVTDPLLTCDDDFTARQTALEWLGFDTETYYGFIVHQYAVLLAGLIKVFGLTVMPALGLSMLATLLSVVLTGVLAVRIAGETPRQDNGAAVRSPQWMAACAMIMIAAQAYWLTMGTLMMKESLVGLGMVLSLTGLTVLWRPAATRAHTLLLAAMVVCGLLLTGLLRLPMAMMAAGASLFMLRRDNLRGVAAVIVLAVIVWALMQTLDVALQPSLYFNDDAIESAYFEYFNERETQAGYMRLIGDYSSWPWLRRILWMPVSVAVQWVIPLAWNAAADVHRAYTLAYAHQGWVWYAEGGLALSWLVTALGGSIRKRHPLSLAERMGLWLAAVWGGIAVMYGGSVSRYLLPMMPVAVCLAEQGWIAWRSNPPLHRVFLIYLALLAAALTTAALM
ncbi:MAG: hypothetical protein NC187_01125 [Candidatus Amulumruptor caecigallinarius]|nr:hypothetical protein [Candidatus Amulumruptor caecigallinarius]MCM1396078.1 hypothetical protein [Candidatus Amulumruptor caecigallinarius]MCM1453913.1 hypothetical protein [bacterium]